MKLLQQIRRVHGLDLMIKYIKEGRIKVDRSSHPEMEPLLEKA